MAVAAVFLVVRQVLDYCLVVSDLGERAHDLRATLHVVNQHLLAAKLILGTFLAEICAVVQGRLPHVPILAVC